MRIKCEQTGMSQEVVTSSLTCKSGLISIGFMSASMVVQALRHIVELQVYVMWMYDMVVMCWLSCQFGGENGEHFVAACSDFCRDQSHALDVLRVHRQKDLKLAAFLQVTLLTIDK